MPAYLLPNKSTTIHTNNTNRLLYQPYPYRLACWSLVRSLGKSNPQAKQLDFYILPLLEPIPPPETLFISFLSFLLRQAPTGCLRTRRRSPSRLLSSAKFGRIDVNSGTASLQPTRLADRTTDPFHSQYAPTVGIKRHHNRIIANNKKRHQPPGLPSSIHQQTAIFPQKSRDQYLWGD